MTNLSADIILCSIKYQLIHLLTINRKFIKKTRSRLHESENAINRK